MCISFETVGIMALLDPLSPMGCDSSCPSLRTYSLLTPERTIGSTTIYEGDPLPPTDYEKLQFLTNDYPYYLYTFSPQSWPPLTMLTSAWKRQRNPRKAQQPPVMAQRPMLLMRELLLSRCHQPQRPMMPSRFLPRDLPMLMPPSTCTTCLSPLQ